MPWVRFTGRFPWSPPPHGQRRTTVYEPGMHLLVTTACAKAAIVAGKALREAKPKGSDDGGRR